MAGRRQRCVVCNKLLTPHHKCPKWILEIVDRQEEEPVTHETDFYHRLRDGFWMIHTKEDYDD